MKLRKDGWMGGAGGWMRWGVMVVLLAVRGWAGAQGVSTTTVQGTVYLANGETGAGTLTVSWPSFTTANGLAVAAGRTSVTIGADGFVSVNLTPNVGATPAGLYYTAVFQLSDGEANTEYWVVPAAAQATLAAVQAQVMPAAQAVQAVSKAYVDNSIAELSGSLLTASGGSLSGPLYLNGDPTTSTEAATKHYVDAQVETAVPLAGGTMTGGLQTVAVNGVEAPAAGTAQATLQAAMTAAGTNGAMTIPPNYAGTDGFTNPNGVRVTDLRTTGAQQTERSVKEFGAVCNGATDDTNALQAALNYANAHGVALTIPQGTCKTRTLSWHGESIGGMGKQVSALMGFPGQDVLATAADATNLLSYTRLHDLTIYVDESVDVSCTPANGRAAAGTCAMSRPMESNTIFAPGGNGQTGAAGTGAAWAVGNCAIAMPAVTGAGGNGLRVAEMENVEIAATGVDPMGAQYPGAHSTHACGLYLAQWPQWSEFRNIDIEGLNTGVAMPALAGTTPAGLNADSNRWQNVTIAATHAFTAAVGSNNVLDNVVALAGNSAATGETPTGLVLDLPLSSTSSGQGWTVRNAVVMPSWTAVQPKLTVTAAGGAVTAVTAGPELGLGFDPYGATVPVTFSGGCTAQATAAVNANGSIGAITVTQGGVGCSATTTASVSVAGNWDTAAPVNLIGGQDMTFYAGNLLKGSGGYTVWNATGSGIYGTQLDGGGGNLPGGGTYSALVANSRLGTTQQVDEFPGADFGAKVQACVNAINPQYGGDCDARNFTGTLAMGANLTISTPNTTVQLPCATIATASQVMVTAGTRNVALHGCALRGSSAASGTVGGTVFLYSGTGAMVQVGDPTYAQDTMGFHMDNAVVNTTASTSATAQGLAAYRTQEMDLESLYFLGNANQTGMTLDGTGNYTGGTFYDNDFNGFQTAVNAVGHQAANPATTDWMNASTFVRLHIDCPESNGNPISGTYGINLQQGDGNTFTGGDVEGCGTALHLGANAQNNTIVGLRNENSISQVVADAGSSYNNWMTGGTMFTGALTDNGTRNSFMDAFHRSFNGMKGDYYGSQQDATVTNHYRLGIGTGNERGLLDEYQTDSGYRWTTGLTDATGGEQYYEIQDQLNNVNRISIGQYNSGQSSTNNQTVINAAGTGAVILNGSNNAGTGGVEIGSGGASETTVATISNAGNAQFNGTLAVGGTTTFSATPTVKNQADAEIDDVLQAGLTTSQKESVIYRDWNGASQWYAEKDASNNWELNSAVGGLDSFKAYQSTNSGDTYINASNATGAVRINYESGAGTAFDIYGGSSSALYASFSGTTTIKFPGLAAGSGHNCLQIDNSGYITNTGSTCSTGVGTVGSGNTGQIAYYTSNGTAIGGVNSVPLTAGGTGATTASGALASLGAFAYPGGTGIPFGLTASTARQATASDVTTLMGYAPLKPANNLSDVASPAAALTNLGGVAMTPSASQTVMQPVNTSLSVVTSGTGALDAVNVNASGTVAVGPTVTEGVTNLSTALTTAPCSTGACEQRLAAATFSCTRTDGLSCFALHNSNSLVGTPGSLLQANGATASSILSNYDPSGNQEYWFARGIGITSTGSTITGAALDLQSVFVNSYLRDSVIYGNANTWAARFQNNGSTQQGFGPFLSENNWYTGSSTTGSKGLLINDQSGGGNFADFTSIADTFENFGAGQTGISITTENGKLNNLYFLQPHWEVGAASTIGFDVGAARNVTIDSPTFGGCCSAQTAIQIESGAANVWVRNMQSSWTNAIVDNINSRTIAAGTSGTALIAQYAIGPPVTSGWDNRGFIYAGNPGGELEIMHPGAEELRMSGTGTPHQSMVDTFYNVGDADPTSTLTNDGLTLVGQGGSTQQDFCIGERHGTAGYWGIFNGPSAGSQCNTSYLFVGSAQTNVPTALRVGDATTSSPTTLYVNGTAEVTGAVTLPTSIAIGSGGATATSTATVGGSAGTIPITGSGGTLANSFMPTSGAGSGTVTDGSGTSTTNQIVTSTSTAHQVQYSSATLAPSALSSGTVPADFTTGATGQYGTWGYGTIATTTSASLGAQAWRVVATVYQDSAVTCSSYGTVQVHLKWSDARGSALSIASGNLTFAATPSLSTETTVGPFLIYPSPTTNIQVEATYTAGSGCSGNGSTYTVIGNAEQVQ